MKTFKKLTLGLGIVAAVFLIISAVQAKKTSALTPADFSGASTSYSKISDSRINATLSDGTVIAFVSTNPTASPLVFKPTPLQFGGGNFCNTSQITLPTGTSPTGSINVRWLNTTTGQDCDTASIVIVRLTYQGPIALSVAGVPPGTTDGTKPCEENSNGWAFAWAACPVLEAASGLSDTLLNIFEDQLSFSVGQLGNVSTPTSGAFKIHQSWSLMRDIATALVVVVMLIMVFSQAFSFGPFDAYTIRKLLPKLVAAVILIQLSWVGVVWIIDLVNAVARGIADLMYYPFGGSQNMDLWHLLENAKLSSGLLTTLNWAALLVGIALGVAFLFTMLGVAFAAIIALLFAVITLVFRKILLILALIFAPLAILLWILPGTERYFKLWRENFLKALLMFPIAVAIIAAGRIFAYVVGTQDNSQFLNLIFILIGFFGPLFILPKTFKWGGQAMQLAGNGIMKAGSQVGGRQRKFMDKRQEGYSAERRQRSAARVASGIGFNKKAPWQSPMDKVRSGAWDPTRGIGQISIGGKQLYAGSKRREKTISQFIAKGTEAEEEDVKFSDAKFKPALDEAADHDKLSRDIGFGGDSETGKKGVVTYLTKSGETRKLGHMSLADRRAGLNAALKYGGGGNVRYVDNTLDQLNNGTAEERVMAEKFRNANAQALLPRMKHVYFAGPNKPGETLQQARDTAFDRTIDNGISESSFASMDSVEAEGMLESLSYRADRGDADSARRLATVLTTYEAAINNDTIRPNIDIGLNKVVEAFVDGQNEKAINSSRAASITAIGGVASPGIVRGAATQPSVAPIVASLSGRIDASGRIQAPTSPTSTAASPMSTIISPTPGEIKIQHNETIVRDLPSPASLTPGSPAREAFKIQLATDSAALQTLAHGIAYDIAPIEHKQVLEEMRTQAVAAGTPEAKASYNRIVDQIQHAYQQRIDETATAVADRGRDPATARGAAGTRLAPEIVNLESTASPPPSGTPDLRKL